MSKKRIHTSTIERLEGTRFNVDRTRYCFPVRRGIACYRGATNERGEWEGRIVGLADNETDALRFLEGALVKLAPVGD